MDATYLEKIPDAMVNHMTRLEMDIMTDIIRRIEINGFSTASADWQISRLQQLGESEESIRRFIKDEFAYEDEELDEIFSDKVYKEYMKSERFYRLKGLEFIPFEENKALQDMIEAMKKQTKDSLTNITQSMVIGTKDILGKVTARPLATYYRITLDNAMMQISTGAFDYQTVLRRTIKELANSGIRTVEYNSGRTDRIEVATRRAIMTGFRQVQNHMNEQMAKDLNTDTYEVSYHVGARPSHQIWEGRVYTMKELQEICGLGSMLGLCGINCYHDYYPFIEGISTRTYTDAQLEQMVAEENELKEFKGHQYTTYQALQEQRRLERAMRADREMMYLQKIGNASDEQKTAVKGHYKTLAKEYTHFSKKMGLPPQWDRVANDGLKRAEKKVSR